MKYRLKNGIGKKKILEMVSQFIPGLKTPKDVLCKMIQENGEYTLTFSTADLEYKVSLFVLLGEALLLSYQRLTGADGRFVPTGFHKVSMEYLVAHDFLEAEVM